MNMFYWIATNTLTECFKKTERNRSFVVSNMVVCSSCEQHLSNLLFFAFCFFRLPTPVFVLIRLSLFFILIFQYVLYFACLYRHVYIPTYYVYNLPYLKALQQKPLIEYEGSHTVVTQLPHAQTK